MKKKSSINQSFVQESASYNNWKEVEQMDREGQSLAVNYIILIVLLCVLWLVYTNVSKYRTSRNGAFIKAISFDYQTKIQSLFLSTINYYSNSSYYSL